jgi:DNA invertase Pin-like site-specific DNA recombinase
MKLTDELAVEARSRARAAIAAIAKAEADAVSARKARDEAIRELALTGMPKAKVAAAVGLSLSTVKAVLR